MKIRMVDDQNKVQYEGEMDMDKLNEFRNYWMDEASGSYCYFVVSYRVDDDGILCFYPDGPWEC